MAHSSFAASLARKPWPLLPNLRILDNERILQWSYARAVTSLNLITKIVPSARKYYNNIPSTVLELVYQYNRVPVKVLNTKSRLKFHVKFFEYGLCTRFLIYRPGAYTVRVANKTPQRDFHGETIMVWSTDLRAVLFILVWQPQGLKTFVYHNGQ